MIIYMQKIRTLSDFKICKFFVFQAIYIGGIVLLSMSLQENYLETWYQTYGIEKYDCKGNEVVADTFWCKWMGQLTGSKLAMWEFFQNSSIQ